MRRSTYLLAILIATVATLPCAASVSVSLPLEGYYRPGRYMPVRVTVQGEPAGELTLSADGAVTTTLQLNGGAADAIVPLLVVTESLGPITWSLPDGQKGTVETKLIPLGEDDRLVGYSGGDAGAASPLFPGETPIPVPLDVSQPLRGPLAAWETLDAAVLEALPNDYPPEFLPAGSMPAEYPAEYLAAGGTAVVVRSAALPKADWLPWHRLGSAWVLGTEPIGPRGAILAEAYLPTHGWKPGRPAATRRQVVLIAVLFSIVAVAATLWRSRFAVVAVVALCAMACGALAYRSRRLSPVAAARGAVLVRRGEVAQVDTWDFYKSMAAATATYRPAPMARPVFASAQHFRRCGLRLMCRSDGQPLVFTFPLTRETSMAFLTRSAAAVSGEKVDTAARNSPLWTLVRDAYLRAGFRAAGQVVEAARESPSDQTEGWPGVVVDAESVR